MMRLIIAFFIACTLQLGFAQRTFTQGQLDYIVISEDERTVSVRAKGSGADFLSPPIFGESSGDIVIPNEVTDNGSVYTVIKIEYPGFSGCDGLTSVMISDNITEIELYTFGSNHNLETFTFPRNIKKLNQGIFQWNRSLKKIIIPEGVEEINSPLFVECPNITDIYSYSIKAPRISDILGYSNVPDYAHTGNLKIHVPKGAYGYANGGWDFSDCKGEIVYDLVTGVEIATIEDKNIYGGTGYLYIYSEADGIVQCSSINGISQELKVTKGKNSYQLPAGVYIVNGKKMIIK